MTYKTTVIIEQDEYGYYAYAPELEGCQTQGETLDEVLANISEAVALYLETMTPEFLFMLAKFSTPKSSDKC